MRCPLGRILTKGQQITFLFPTHFLELYIGHRSPRQFSLSCMPRCSKHSVCLLIGNAAYKRTAKVRFSKIVFVSVTEHNSLCRIFSSLSLARLSFLSFFFQSPALAYFFFVIFPPPSPPPPSNITFLMIRPSLGKKKSKLSSVSFKRGRSTVWPVSKLIF